MVAAVEQTCFSQQRSKTLDTDCTPCLDWLCRRVFASVRKAVSPPFTSAVNAG